MLRNIIVLKYFINNFWPINTTRLKKLGSDFLYVVTIQTVEILQLIYHLRLYALLKPVFFFIWFVL
ncbi:hypothetical protein [Acinetobacter phage Ab69]|nr:hypothetical protein [Acinetobacter phage Ab69]